MAARLIQDVTFTQYAKKVDNRNDDALDTTAKNISRNQYNILRAKVQDWSGTLAESITVRSTDDERTIGPVGVAYAAYIEDGGGSFEGYHYIRDSVRPEQQKFNRLIERNLERS